jgi:phage/plasmid-associated DNA primase
LDVFAEFLQRRCGIYQFAFERPDDHAAPDEVNVAVEEYKKSMDWLAPFFAECCVADHDPARTETSANLYAAYVKWAGDGAMPQRTFGSQLGERGFVPRKDGNGDRYWRGIELNAANKPPTAEGHQEQHRQARKP